MFGGVEPVIIIQLSSLVGSSFADQIAKIPVVSQIPTVIDQPPIPIYLSESLTGIYVDSESKNVDIQTTTETRSDGEAPDVNQKGIANTVTVLMTAKKTSLSMALLSALIDVVFERVTAKEYSITYLNGPITVFRGVVHSFSVDQQAGNDLLQIKFEISKGEKQPTKVPGPDLANKFTGTAAQLP